MDIRGSRASIVVVAARFANKIGYGLGAVAIARWLGPEGNGIFALISVICALVMLAVGAGTNVSTRLSLSGSPMGSEIRIRLAVAVKLSLILALLTIPITPIALIPALRLAEVTASFWPLTLAGCLLSFSLLAVRQARDGALGFSASRATVISGAWSLAFAVVVAAVAATLGDPVWVIVAVASVYLLETMTLVGARPTWLTKDARQFSISSVRESAWSGSQLWRLYRSGWSAAPATIGQAAALRADRILLGILASAEELGVYAAAVAVSESVWAVSQGLAEFRFSREGKTRPPTRLRHVLLSSAILGGIILLSAPLAIPLAFGEDYSSAVPMLWLLVPASVVFGAYHVAAYTMWNCGDLRTPSRISLVGVAVLVVLATALIPTWGAFGAAIATLISYSLMAILSLLGLRQGTTAS